MLTALTVVVTSLAVQEFRLSGHVADGSVTGLIPANAAPAAPIVQMHATSSKKRHTLVIPQPPRWDLLVLRPRTDTPLLTRHSGGFDAPCCFSGTATGPALPSRARFPSGTPAPAWRNDSLFVRLLEQPDFPLVRPHTHNAANFDGLIRYTESGVKKIRQEIFSKGEFRRNYQ